MLITTVNQAAPKRACLVQTQRSTMQCATPVLKQLRDISKPFLCRCRQNSTRTRRTRHMHQQICRHTCRRHESQKVHKAHIRVNTAVSNSLALACRPQQHADLSSELGWTLQRSTAAAKFSKRATAPIACRSMHVCYMMHLINTQSTAESASRNQPTDLRSRRSCKVVHHAGATGQHTDQSTADTAQTLPPTYSRSPLCNCTQWSTPAALQLQHRDQVRLKAVSSIVRPPMQRSLASFVP
jgi:hypothetical protein